MHKAAVMKDEQERYRELRELKRLVQLAMKENGCTVRQRDVAIIESYAHGGHRYGYIMYIDKNTTDVFRLYFSKKYYSYEHRSFWEIDKVPNGMAAVEVL